MTARRKEIPKFDSEVEEREFWRIHDAAQYLDLSRMQPAVFPNLKPTTRTNEELG